MKLTTILREARDREGLEQLAYSQAEAQRSLLMDHLGGCERIKKTPLPFAYMVHIRRALILYCFTLPFALVESYGWGSIVGTLLVAYIFFGIEEIGVEIENPFDGDENDIPLERICATIERNLFALIGDDAPAAAGEPDTAEAVRVPVVGLGH